MFTAKHFRALSLAAAAALLASACAAPAPAGPASSASPASGRETPPSAPAAERTEVSSLAPRAVLTYDGGVMTVDTSSGEVLATAEMDGFLRLNNAGDGRHVLVSTGGGFSLFDSGLIVQGHGDHSHYFVSPPRLTGETVKAPEPGHVVLHNGKTALFSDGTGAVTVLEPDDLADGALADAETWEHSASAAHHGVAVPLSSGDLLLTQGTHEARNTVQVLSADWEVIAETADCPGVHGEAAARPTGGGDVIALGCENGPVIYRDGAFHKAAVEEDYQRSGNLFGHADSPIILGDYKTDPDAALERPTHIGLFNTLIGSVTKVDLGSAYWFRSLARGAGGEALVLTYDGQLHVLDAETGEVIRKIAVVQPWEEPGQWQQPAPLVKVGTDGLAYVTDAAARVLHVVDIDAGTVRATFGLPETPVELAVVTGQPETSPHADSHDGHSH